MIDHLNSRGWILSVPLILICARDINSSSLPLNILPNGQKLFHLNGQW